MSRKKAPLYVTAQDIVIPAGTELGLTAARRVFTPHVSAVIGHGKDSTSQWDIDLEEALELGLVKEAG